MKYLPHTEEEIKEMLKTCSAEKIEDLFCSIPSECRREKELDLPGPLSELELLKHFKNLLANVRSYENVKSFLGAGNYEHYIPAVIPYLLQRGEFLTPYTPYQPEVSQGTLQALFEYQTLICKLLSMEVSNASVYDGATALVEAVLMAKRIKNNRNCVILSQAVHPHYREVLKTYAEPLNIEIIDTGYTPEGTTNFEEIQKRKNVIAIVVQYPNFFGVIEDLEVAGEIAKELDCLFIVVFTEPIAFGLLKPPGEYGVDICCGEGQSLGLPSSFGGPALGIFTCKKIYVRNLPGRIVGMTRDREGKRGFVLTLSTREQHIRREKATSNICSNQNLCALAAAMYLAVMGEKGIREVAYQCYCKTEYLKSLLKEKGVKIPFSGPTFNEFVIDLGENSETVFNKLLEEGIILGLPLKNYYPELKHCYLIAVTETKSKEDLELLAERVENYVERK